MVTHTGGGGLMTRLALALSAAALMLAAPRSAAAQNFLSVAPDALLTVGSVTVAGGADRNAAQTLSETLSGIGAQVARCIAPTPRAGEVTPTHASRAVSAVLRLRFDATGALVPSGVRVTGRGVARGAAACIASALAETRAPAPNVTAATAALRAQWAIMYEGPRVLESPRPGATPPVEVRIAVSVEALDNADATTVAAANRMMRARASTFRRCLQRFSQLGSGLRATYFVTFGPAGAVEETRAERPAGPETASECLINVMRSVRLPVAADGTTPPAARVRVVLLYDAAPGTSPPAPDRPARDPLEPRRTNVGGE